MGPLSSAGGLPGCRKEPIMRTFANSVVNFRKREDGPTAVEYAVMLALIVIVCLASIRLITPRWTPG